MEEPSSVASGPVTSVYIVGILHLPSKVKDFTLVILFYWRISLLEILKFVLRWLVLERFDVGEPITALNQLGRFNSLQFHLGQTSLVEL